ncbi:hypothetical protein XENORESO_003047 [Xenotaenia resolanae]|uniref:Secreted protein n=1 Tax=Xenotaenia resolanae TaxID=208358 RepID=A0ABV0W169_9TELE
MLICMCAFVLELIEDRLCVVRSISGCGAVVAHGCVFRMSAKPASSTERIARFRGVGAEKWISPGVPTLIRSPVNLPDDRWFLSATHFHVSPCLSEARQLLVGRNHGH